MTWDIEFSPRRNSMIIILFLYLDRSKYFKNAEGKYN